MSAARLFARLAFWRRPWALVDVARLAAANPYTFHRPSQQAIEATAPHDSVKLMFEDRRGDIERLWVRVVARRKDGRFEAVLDADPQAIAGIARGRRVVFEPRHVVDTTARDPEGGTAERYAARCLVTHGVLYDDLPVAFLYRLLPVADKDARRADSGWRLRARGEPNPDIDDGETVFRVSLGAVLTQDDRFVDLLDAPPGSAFEWEPEFRRFAPARFPGADPRTLH